MNIAIAATSPEADAQIDQHGARAPYYQLFDTGAGLTEVLPNPVSKSERGAGPQAAAFLVSKGVDMVVAGDFGPRFRAELEDNNITCTEMTGSVSGVAAKLSGKT